MGNAGTVKTAGVAGTKRTGRELVREYAMPVGIAVAAGVLGGVVAVKAFGLGIAMGVAAGILTAVATYQKVDEALSKLRA
jgi:hypothetical protein